MTYTPKPNGRPDRMLAAIRAAGYPLYTHELMRAVGMPASAAPQVARLMARALHAGTVLRHGRNRVVWALPGMDLHRPPLYRTFPGSLCDAALTALAQLGSATTSELADILGYPAHALQKTLRRAHLGGAVQQVQQQWCLVPGAWSRCALAHLPDRVISIPPAVQPPGPAQRGATDADDGQFVHRWVPVGQGKHQPCQHRINSVFSLGGAV